MDTVADTITPEDYANYERAFNPQSEESACLSEAARKLKSRADFYRHSDPIDYLLEETGEMEGFFSFLSRPAFEFRRIYDVCVDFLIDSKEPKEDKVKVMEDLYTLMDFHHGLASSGGFIAEKAYYFEDFWNQIKNVMKKSAKD